jgi:glycerol-3-phosphate dehydrogenase
VTDSLVQVRQRRLRALSDETFDVLVVGGGITGASVARDAVLRGLKVALIEKRDFASGTSSKSTKLIHGGIRYLEQAELGLVFESVNERKRLMRLARHLVRPLPFLMTNYQGDRRWLVTLDAGLWLYEALCFFGAYRLHRTYGKKRTLELEPGLKPDGLKGGIVYYDAITDDARLTLENVIDAVGQGAVLANHVRAGALLHEGPRVAGVSAVDELSDERFGIRAKVVVSAAGPWSDEVRSLVGQPKLLKPTKGVHIVVDAKRLPLNHALVLSAPRDKRVVFAIPWGWGRTVIGTTDTFFDGTADKVEPTAADIDYLLEIGNAYAPAAHLTPDDVLATWSGLRPLLKPANEGAGASQVSREHTLLEQPGFLTIAGGKLTTYRRMALEVVDRACAQLGQKTESVTANRALPGSQGLEDDDSQIEALIASLSATAGASRAQLFAETYGARSPEVLARLSKPEAATPLDPELPAVMAQVDEAMENELASTLDDVLSRRIPLILRARDQGLAIAPAVCAHMARRLGWSATRAEAELAEYRAEVQSSRAFRVGDK